MNKRAQWLCPFKHTPPKGSKINVLTVGGISVIGHWKDSDCVAWHPLLDTPPEIKERMVKWAVGDETWNKENNKNG